MKIKEYKTIHGSNLDILDERINESICLGYTPIGGPTFNNLIEDAFPEGKNSDMYGEEMIAGFTQAMVKYEKCGVNIFEYEGHIYSSVDNYLGVINSTSTESKEKKLIDFSVNWYPTVESMNRNEKEFIEEGWKTFKKESLDYNTEVMTHKLMMVKYE